MPDIDCPYIGECTSHPMMCRSCEHNRGKKDHYKPINPPPEPPRVVFPPVFPRPERPRKPWNPWDPDPTIVYRERHRFQRAPALMPQDTKIIQRVC